MDKPFVQRQTIKNKIFFISKFTIVILQYIKQDMGLTKSEIFSDEQNRLASLFKVLAHPARVAILQYIISQKACICNDLVEELGLAQATISQHLKELKNIGIIQGTIEGKSVCYCIDENVWKKIQTDFNTFFNQEVKVNKCC